MVRQEHSMERSYNLLLQNEHDDRNALDDLLNCPERNEEAEWTFRNDLLAADMSSLGHEGNSMNKEDAVSESLEDISYLNDMDTRKDLSGVKSPGCSSLTFENMETAAGAQSPNAECEEDFSLGGKDIQNKAISSQHVSALSGIPPNWISTSVDRPDCSSENENAVPYWDGVGQPALEQSHLVESSDFGSVSDKVGYSMRKEVQKPPTTAGIGLEDLKAVFHLERPKAEKKLRLKRTTFSNLSRHYGISKWPFRTIRDAMNRMEANNRLLINKNISKERHRKLTEQQRLLSGVIKLIYSDPRESRDSNTLAVLLRMVAARESRLKYSDL